MLIPIDTIVSNLNTNYDARMISGRQSTII
jgi:hypothetical protein